MSPIKGVQITLYIGALGSINNRARLNNMKDSTVYLTYIRVHPLQMYPKF
jgi:hypothetical protein